MNRPGLHSQPLRRLGDIQSVTLTDSDGSIRILNVVNSLDTPIYGIATRRWEQLRSKLPGNVMVLTISMDLPFAQARWGQGADLGHEVLSSQRSEEFGRSHGVLIKEWRMLQRAVLLTGCWLFQRCHTIAGRRRARSRRFGQIIAAGPVARSRQIQRHILRICM